MNGPPKREAAGVLVTPAAADRKEGAASVQADDDDACNAPAVAPIIARLTAAGFCVSRLEGGGFLVSRWQAMTKHCPDARALAGFAHQVGARA